jgi:DNA-directed RNA polymerase specialized sigma24 family protein
VQLVIFEQLGFPEVKVILALPDARIKSAYYRGLKRLRECLLRKGCTI